MTGARRRVGRGPHTARRSDADRVAVFRHRPLGSAEPGDPLPALKPRLDAAALASRRLFVEREAAVRAVGPFEHRARLLRRVRLGDRRRLRHHAGVERRGLVELARLDRQPQDVDAVSVGGVVEALVGRSPTYRCRAGSRRSGSAQSGR